MNNNTIFLRENDNIAEALGRLTEGGTAVICQRISAVHARIGTHTGRITVTSVYDGHDYREDGAALVFDSSVTLTMGGECIIENTTIEISSSGVIAANFHPFTLGEGVEVLCDMSVEQNGLYIIGGENNEKNTKEIYSQDTHLTVQSGCVSRLVGFSRGCADRVHSGHTTINVGGDAYVRYLVTGAMGDRATAGSAEVHIADNAVIEALHMGGARAENTLSGDCVITVDGGDIYRFDTVGLSAVLGKRSLIYDPRKAPDGLLFLARMVRFDSIESICDLAGHAYGEAYENPFDPSLKIHTCSFCGHTESAEPISYNAYEGVLFVADGGFGDGRSPAFPLGDYESAQRMMAHDGGRIVLVGRTTLRANVTDPHGSAPDAYIEPVHEGEITLCCVHDGIDYRERGACLDLGRGTDYRMSGPLRIEKARIEASDGCRLVARYEPLYIAEDVHTPDKAEDMLEIIGGYLGFSARDLDRCTIPEEFHNIVCSARPLPEDFEKKTELSPISIAPKLSLRPRAAEAFNQMFRDMKAQGLKLPTVTDAFRPYARQYSLYMGYICRLRKTFGYSFKKAKSVVDRSCAMPRCSEHHYGVAVDMYDFDLTQFKKKHHYYDLTPEWAWISEHGREYGIILRYPADKVDITGCIYEPWHFRYVGRDTAYVISRRGITLEEYAGAMYGAFELDSHITVLSGSYNEITAFSRNTGLIQLTGKHFITIGDNVKLKRPNNDASEC